MYQKMALIFFEFRPQNFSKKKKKQKLWKDEYIRQIYVNLSISFKLPQDFVSNAGLVNINKHRFHRRHVVLRSRETV